MENKNVNIKNLMTFNTNELFQVVNENDIWVNSEESFEILGLENSCNSCGNTHSSGSGH